MFCAIGDVSPALKRARAFFIPRLSPDRTDLVRGEKIWGQKIAGLIKTVADRKGTLYDKNWLGAYIFSLFLDQINDYPDIIN